MYLSIAYLCIALLSSSLQHCERIDVACCTGEEYITKSRVQSAVDLAVLYTREEVMMVLCRAAVKKG